MGVRNVGAAVARIEDPRLITGGGSYVDDLVLPHMLHAAFVRSADAHALIRNIDCSAARASAGVVAVFTADDLGELGSTPMAQTVPSPQIRQAPTWRPLASQEVCHVGEAIAVVVADSRAAAEDAVALVAVETEAIDAVVDLKGALAADAPKAHAGTSNNLVASLSGRFGDAKAVFAGAPHIFREQLLLHRGGCHSMECRGLVASWSQGQLTLWSSTQSPYLVRRGLARHLGLDEQDVRLIAPDVGGGFGPKAVFYPEEIVLPLVSRLLNKPVKWIEDRREHFISTTQQRGQLWDVEVAANEEGRLLAVRGRCLHDNGAYVPYGLILPASTIASFPGPYALEALDITLDVVMTNIVPTTPVRGAGRPNAAFVLERLADRVAHELKLEPAEVRRRSFVRKDQFPYKTGMMARDGTAIAYDSGDYHACLDAAVRRFDIGDFRRRQTQARAEGRYLGVGIASYVEDTGLAPFEGATVRVQPSGRIVIETGAASQGQGHATIFAQITSDLLGVKPDDITVRSADTGAFPLGIGTIASRVAVTGGSSVFLAATGVRQKAIKVAAEMLEAAEEDLVLEGGKVHVAGVPDMNVPLGAIAARLSGVPGVPMPRGVQPGLSDTAYFEARQTTFANGTNIAEVEVDLGTGAMHIQRYVVAHDCGTMINPMLVEGQIRGGVVHGIGNALLEQMLYDESGQPLTTNYGEYLLPTAPEMPRIEIVHLEVASPLNPIGAKGVGEGGTIPATACVVAAVEDALTPFGIRLGQHPITPQIILGLIGKTQRSEHVSRT
jgi:aerobic carbon-monoxide dehydrogenase large subunit